MTFEQGQTVLYVSNGYGRNPTTVVKEVTIERAARKYVYVQINSWGDPTAFDKVTGSEKPDYRGMHNSRLYTHDGWAEKARRDLLWDRFKDAGVVFAGFGSRERESWSTEKLLRVVEALES